MKYWSATNQIPCTLAPDNTTLVITYIYTYFLCDGHILLMELQQYSFQCIKHLLRLKEYMKPIIKGGDAISVTRVVVVGTPVIVHIAEVSGVAAIRRCRT